MTRSAALVACLLCAAQAVAADSRRVRVRVVDVTAYVAYLEPGAKAGLRYGTEIRFKDNRYRVEAVYEDGAMISARDGQLRVGQRGIATVTELELVDPSKAGKSHRGMWPKVPRPAAGQDVEQVAIHQQDRSGLDVLVSQSSAAIVPLSGDATPVLRGELRGRVAYTAQDVPLTFRADASLLGWWVDSPIGADSRPLARVRELSLAYGTRDAAQVALGRLRYASSQVGTLDGVAGEYALADGLVLRAFAGAPPDPLDQMPTVDAGRFGAELRYVRSDLAWRPELSLGGHTSVFDGRLDERRLYGSAHVYPGASRLSAFAEASFFDADNPWQAPRGQLTAAALDADTRIGPVYAAARVDARRLERSLRLDAVFPRTWLCTTQAAIGSGSSENEVCANEDALRYWTTGEVGVDFDAWKLRTSVGALLFTEDRGYNTLSNDSLARYVLRFDKGSIDAIYFEGGGFWTDGDLLSTYGGTLSLGTWWLAQRGDVVLRYRPEVLSYQVNPDSWLQHRAGASARFMLDAQLTLTLDVDTVVGRDVDALYIMSNAIWHPKL